MAEEKKNNKLITILLAIVLLIAAVTLIYFYLPKDTSNKTPNGNENNQQNESEYNLSEIILTLKFEDQELNYSLEKLENLEAYTDNATMIKKGNVTVGPNEYTGVKISTLLNEIENLPGNYTINVTSTDGYIKNYNLSQIQGNVDIFNESGVVINDSGAIMILAYKIDGEYFTQNDTLPLRIVFCNENMTSSNLWAKMVNSIEIIEQ